MKRPFQCFLKVAPWSSEHADGKIHGGDMDDDPLGKKVEPCLPIYLCKLPQNLFPQIQVFFLFEGRLLKTVKYFFNIEWIIMTLFSCDVICVPVIGQISV